MSIVELSSYQEVVDRPHLRTITQAEGFGEAGAAVGNDPVNGRDPTGTYSCSSSMNERQCGAFQEAQRRALSIIRTNLSAIRALQRTLSQNGRLTSSQRALQSSLDKYIGKGTGNSAVALGRLAQAGSSMVAALEGGKAFMSSSVQKGTSYAENGPIRPGTVYPAFFASSPSQRTQTIGHEAGHEIRGVGDLRFQNGVGPYGRANVLAIGRMGAADSMRNAENLAYAFGLDGEDE